MIFQYKLNLLSFVSIAFGTLFIILLGRRFGASIETDSFFIANTLVIYLSHFVMLTWDAVAPFYAANRLKSEGNVSGLYIFLLVLISSITLLIVSLFVFLYSIGIIPTNYSTNIVFSFCVYFVFYNIIALNKTILNLEGMYASGYISDILVNATLLMFVFFGRTMDEVVLAFVVGPLVCICLQFIRIFKKIGVSFPQCPEYMSILRGSIAIKSGSLLYGLKDLIILRYLSSIDEGIVSLFSFANKFASVILQVISAPIVNVFGSRAAHWVANNELDKTKVEIKKTLKHLVFLYCLGVALTYALLPSVVSALFGDKFSESDIIQMKYMFSLICVFNLIWIIQAPFGRVITVARKFLVSLSADIIFTICLTPIFFYFLIQQFKVLPLFATLIFAQFAQCVFLLYMLKKYFR